MTDPREEEAHSDDPAPGGQDSVQAMHAPMMDAMNEQAIVGTDPLPSGDREPVTDLPTNSVLMREKAEPKDGFEPAPFLVYVIFGILLLWGGFYFGTKSGPMTDTITIGGVELPWFDSKSYDRDDLSPLGNRPAGPVAEPNPQSLDDYKQVGAQVYANVCQACHMPDGKGNPAQGIPPLAGSEWVAGAEASPARLSRIVLYGLSGPVTVAGRPYNGLMPAQGGSLKDYQIAGALTFVRNNFGNAADQKDASITTAVVKAARAKEPNRPTTGTAAMSEAMLKAIPVTQSDIAAPEKADGAAPEKK